MRGVGEVRKRMGCGEGQKPFGLGPIRGTGPDHRMKGSQLLPGDVIPEGGNPARQGLKAHLGA